MEDDRSISEAVRHLEDLRAAGYITPEQFTSEVRGLLLGLGMDDDAAALAAEAASAGNKAAPEPEPEAGTMRLFDLVDPGPEPEPDLPPPHEDPRPEQAFAPTGTGPRVTIMGSVPWEQKQQATGVRVEEAEASDRKQRDDKVLHHRQLADMATRDVTRLQRKRNPKLVALASLLLPGLGQFMLDQPGPGAGFALVHLMSLAVVIVFGEFEALYVMVPAALLAAALAHKDALMHNYQLERRRLLAQRRAKDQEARLNVDRSVREGEWENLGRDRRLR